MQISNFFKGVCAGIFVLAAFSTADAQVGGAGGENASVRFNQSKKEVKASLSDMLIAEQPTVENAFARTAPKPKSLAGIKQRQQKTGSN